MISISIEVPEREQYRFEPLVNLQNIFQEDDISIHFRRKGADLRIVELEAAIQELPRNPNRRFPTPIIIDEENDGAEVSEAVAARSLMAHPDVKFWLKRNTFRDYRLNNKGFRTTQYHTEILNDIPNFHIDVPEHKCAMQLTAEMASKIRLIPTVGIDLLTFFRQQEINWTETRPIDVIYAGWVDYPAPYHFHEATRVLASRHRRAAIQQLARLRGLRVLIGMNQALSADIYKTTMMRSLISVSPWGLGEYAYRDYESILAGCVMVKPLTDHVLTFPPDIYQSGNHYIRCNPDFTDLARTIESILDDQGHAIELARRAREAMLRENAPEKIHAYYLNLFREALA